MTEVGTAAGGRCEGHSVPGHVHCKALKCREGPTCLRKLLQISLDQRGAWEGVSWPGQERTLCYRDREEPVQRVFVNDTSWNC